MGEGHRLSRLAVTLIVLAAAAALAFRLIGAVAAAIEDDLEPLRAIGFSVAFPLALLLPLLRMGPSRTEGAVLMRFGTAVQLILIAASARWGLHLLLGLPVVFLLVELAETRLPRGIRDPIVVRLVEGTR